jgi:hypothetical protein
VPWVDGETSTGGAAEEANDVVVVSVHLGIGLWNVTARNPKVNADLNIMVTVIMVREGSMFHFNWREKIDRSSLQS